MTKNYLVKFGSGNPASFSGLSPTFITFYIGSTFPWLTATPPGISEISAGVGLYTFAYGTSLSIAFVVDGGNSLSSTDRFVTGILDPLQAIDQKIGFPTDSIGTTNIDPTTALGWLRRNQEFEEGLAYFDKTTGIWSIQTRGATTFQTRTLTNAAGSVTKS